MVRLRTLCAIFLCALAAIITAQNREVNWPTYAGDAQRSGWQKTETRITKSTAKDLQLLWKMKLDVPAKGARSLLPPVILGRLISYRGFKELAFVGTNADIVYAIDADLGKMFWQKHLEYVSNEAHVSGSSAVCPGGLTAMPVMPTPPPGGRGAGPGAATGPFISGPLSLYVLSSDGRIHRVNTSTGDDVVQPVSVLPPNARASSLNIVENVIYTVTSRNCSDAPDAVWAIDLNADAPKAASFPIGGTGDWGLEGVAISSDGTVYAGDSKTLYALSPRDLQLRHRFPLARENVTIVTSPVVFNYKSRDILVVAGNDGRIYTVEPASQRIERSSPVAGSEGGISGVSTWEDATGTRWIFASASGKGSSAGSIASFRVEEQGDRIALSPGWVSREINSSVPSVIANGVVFAISGPGRAILYALDATTGKELYSSRNLVTAPAASTGLTIANGRVYFGATDGTFYAFGIYMEH
jgi:outer membrane protein assembly factor BamB